MDELCIQKAVNLAFAIKNFYEERDGNASDIDNGVQREEKRRYIAERKYENFHFKNQSLYV